MTREYRVLHHRQQGIAGGHWDLTENPIPYRQTSDRTPHGDGSLCAALESLGGEGWSPVMEMEHAHSQPGETFLLIAREA